MHPIRLMYIQFAVSGLLILGLFVWFSIKVKWYQVAIPRCKAVICLAIQHPCKAALILVAINFLFFLIAILFQHYRVRMWGIPPWGWVILFQLPGAWATDFLGKINLFAFLNRGPLYTYTMLFLNSLIVWLLGYSSIVVCGKINGIFKTLKNRC